GALSRLGAGIFQIAPFKPKGDPESKRAFQIALAKLSASSGRLTTFMLGGDASYLQGLDEMAELGADVAAQLNVRPVSNYLSFKTKLPFDKLQEWESVRRQPVH